MPFETRCPECTTKLRLDAAPAAGTPVECPKCGSLFVPPRTANTKVAAAAKSGNSGRPRDDDEDGDDPPRPTAKKSGGGIKKPKSIKITKTSNPNNTGKKRKAKKKVTNPIVVLVAIGCGFGVLTAIFFSMIYFLNRAGKVQEMLTYVPAEVNWVRGVNVSLLAKYKGYAAEVTKFYRSDIKAAADHSAKAAGNDTDAALDYLIIAKHRQDSSTTGTMYVLRMARSMKPDALAAGLGATSAGVNGETGYKFGPGAPGILANATMIVPTSRIVAIIAPGRVQGPMTSAATVGKGGKGDSFAAKLNATSKVVIRGSIWLLMRNTGHFSNYLENSVKVVKDDFSMIADKSKSATMFGVWTSPGGSGVRIGAAFECADKATASAIVKSMYDGPLGKADESEAPNQLKSAGLSFITDKKVFGEFMQNVDFKTSRECVYVISSLTGENAKRVLDTFNSPTMGSD